MVDACVENNFRFLSYWPVAQKVQYIETFSRSWKGRQQRRQPLNLLHKERCCISWAFSKTSSNCCKFVMGLMPPSQGFLGSLSLFVIAFQWAFIVSCWCELIHVVLSLLSIVLYWLSLCCCCVFHRFLLMFTNLPHLFTNFETQVTIPQSASWNCTRASNYHRAFKHLHWQVVVLLDFVCGQY